MYWFSIPRIHVITVDGRQLRDFNPIVIDISVVGYNLGHTNYLFILITGVTFQDIKRLM